MTTAEALAVVRSALEEVTPCGCPKGMKYHALNCGVAPGELQADAALALIEERVEEDTEEWERIAQEHGVVFLLDHLGLDGFGNQVRDLRRRAEKAEAERDDATAALERMRLELLRVDEMVSRYSQSADGFTPFC